MSSTKQPRDQILKGVKRAWRGREKLKKRDAKLPPPDEAAVLRHAERLLDVNLASNDAEASSEQRKAYLAGFLAGYREGRAEIGEVLVDDADRKSGPGLAEIRRLSAEKRKEFLKYFDEEESPGVSNTARIRRAADKAEISEGTGRNCLKWRSKHGK